jgi:quercetin dioxygenase-like cupin family protein
MPIKNKVIFDAIEWFEAGDGMRYKRFQQGDMQIRLVEWDRSMIHADWCLKGHTGYILEGRVEIDIAGTVETYGPGDALIIPEGEEYKHRPKVLTDKVQFFSVEKRS